jgi:hypothetical protein
VLWPHTPLKIPDCLRPICDAGILSRPSSCHGPNAIVLRKNPKKVNLPLAVSCHVPVTVPRSILFSCFSENARSRRKFHRLFPGWPGVSFEQVFEKDVLVRQDSDRWLYRENPPGYFNLFGNYLSLLTVYVGVVECAPASLPPRVLLPHTCTQDGWFLQPKRRPARLPRRTVPSNCICRCSRMRDRLPLHILLLHTQVS